MQSRFLTRPWPDLVSFYRDLVETHKWELEPLLKLVEYIAQSPYSGGLFGATSHSVLHIGRVQNFACGDNNLSIAFDQAARSFRFEFEQREDDRHPWSISCGELEGQQTFRRVLHKRLRWFHEG